MPRNVARDRRRAEARIAARLKRPRCVICDKPNPVRVAGRAARLGHLWVGQVPEKARRMVRQALG